MKKSSNKKGNPKKERLDIILVGRGFADSRTKAQALIMAGAVFVSGEKVHKPSLVFDHTVEISLKDSKENFVSRGGHKLSPALDCFNVSPEGLVCLDIGASTGGFTDCLLKKGAKKVYAVDVGYGLLHESLRKDPRVIVIERTNARFLSKEHVKDPVGFVTIDCSFISLKLLLKPVFEIISEGGIVIPLVKPQFEVGKGEVGRGGVVRDPAKRAAAVKQVVNFAVSLGFCLNGEFESPVKGPKGNIEYFLFLRKSNDINPLTRELDIY